MRLLPALAVASFVGLSSPAFACPENCFFTPAGVWTCTTAASADTAFDASAGPGCFKSQFSRGYRAGYDLPHGTLYAEVRNGFDGLCGPGVAVHDNFVLGGLPAGTTIPVRVQLGVRFWINCILPGGSHGFLRIESGAQSAAVDIALDDFSQEGDRDTSLVLPLTLAAGTPFPLTLSMQVRTGECLSAMNGTVMFLDLPAGASIGSCNGFSQGPTPARKTTWGALKAGYR